jgi:3' exoribonuclease, RNase T-like
MDDHMRIWFDTEFDENGKTIELISIGMVTEDGREYYAVNSEYDPTQANDWLKQNVLNCLGNTVPKRRSEIQKDISVLVGRATPEFWAYFGEYDWIVLRQLFGNMMQWPQGWPLSHRNLEQFRIDLDLNDLPKQEQGIHNALEDARWTKKAWEYAARKNGAIN